MASSQLRVVARARAIILSSAPATMSTTTKLLRNNGYDAKAVCNETTGFAVRYGQGARKDLLRLLRKQRRLEAKAAHELRVDRAAVHEQFASPALDKEQSRSRKPAAATATAVPSDPRAFLELYAARGLTPALEAAFARAETAALGARGAAAVAAEVAAFAARLADGSSGSAFR